MANTVSLLTYDNTFADWVITTNYLAQENNNLAVNDYTKSTGTLFLNDTSKTGLVVANNATVGGQLQVQGVGSSAYVQNNLRVDKQAYFQNTSLSLTTSGQANIGGPLLALSSGTGLHVSNNATITNNVIVSNSITVSNNIIVSNNLTSSNIIKNISKTINIIYGNENNEFVKEYKEALHNIEHNLLIGEEDRYLTNAEKIKIVIEDQTINIITKAIASAIIMHYVEKINSDNI